MDNTRPKIRINPVDAVFAVLTLIAVKVLNDWHIITADHVVKMVVLMAIYAVFALKNMLRLLLYILLVLFFSAMAYFLTMASELNLTKGLEGPGMLAVFFVFALMFIELFFLKKDDRYPETSFYRLYTGMNLLMALTILSAFAVFLLGRKAAAGFQVSPSLVAETVLWSVTIFTASAVVFTYFTARSLLSDSFMFDFIKAVHGTVEDEEATFGEEGREERRRVIRTLSRMRLTAYFMFFAALTSVFIALKYGHLYELFHIARAASSSFARLVMKVDAVALSYETRILLRAAYIAFDVWLVGSFAVSALELATGKKLKTIISEMKKDAS